MKTLRNTVLALGLVGSVALAQAAAIVLDFERIADGAPVGDYYNGGGGPNNNYGISFSPNALALVNSGSFSNEPSPSTAMYFEDANNVYLNYAEGFSTGFSFFYSSATNALVNVYDGLSLTGSSLASVNLNAQFNLGCSEDPDGGFCNFSAVEVNFEGIARSIDFGGTANQTIYDDISFDSTRPDKPDPDNPDNGGNDGGENNDVPEPATLALLGIALAGMGASRRHSAKHRC